MFDNITSRLFLKPEARLHSVCNGIMLNGPGPAVADPGPNGLTLYLRIGV